MQFDRGYLVALLHQQRREADVDPRQSYVLLYDKKVANVRDLLPLLRAGGEGGRPLLVIAEEVETKPSRPSWSTICGASSDLRVKAPGS